VKEDIEYVESIKQDVQWLGFQWNGEICYSSDYFDKLHGYAIELIEKGLAYVDELSAEQMREYRGTLTAPGKNSPFRDRSVAENLALFEKMKNGEFAEGAACLRAKIDMASPFMVMRDPVIYRIKFAHHHMTSLTASRTPWKGSPTPSVRWSSRTTVACTTGCWTTSPSTATPVSTSSPD